MSATKRWYFDAFGGEKHEYKRRDGNSRHPYRDMKLRIEGNELITEGAIVQNIMIVGTAAPAQPSARANAIHLAKVIQDMSVFIDRLAACQFPTGNNIDDILARVLEADQVRNEDGLTNWVEGGSSKTVLYAVDPAVLWQHIGNNRYSFAREAHLRDPITVQNMVKATVGRRLAVTNKSYAALVPSSARCGDVICILWGARVPFVLRPEEDHYVLIGDCYVEGMMCGELFEDEKTSPRMQEIRIH